MATVSAGDHFGDIALRETKPRSAFSLMPAVD